MAKVLIACECSGVVRDAFLSLGHKAMSCDLKPTERLGPHYVGNVWDLIECPRDKGTWDLIIAHPPCDHIAVSGAAHFAAKRADGRQQMGVDFFMLFTRLTCKWAIENPVGIMSTLYRKPDQIIQPHELQMQWRNNGATHYEPNQNQASKNKALSPVKWNRGRNIHGEPLLSVCVVARGWRGWRMPNSRRHASGRNRRPILSFAVGSE